MADKHELRDRGLRLTPQRELVLAAVREYFLKQITNQFQMN